MSKTVEAHTGELGKGKSISLSEISSSAGIEPVSENDFAKNVSQEAFMNDLLTIVVAEDNSKNALPVIVPSVNGINQPIVRGHRVKVKRKYIEALARCTYTRYEQQTPDPSKPENIRMLEKTALVYPFTVYDDPHPNGREWLQAILKGA
jgi:disulfide oxidoreductase YuzD